MDEIHKRLSEYPVVSNALKQVYDLELNKEDIVSTLCELDRIEPFGKGLEAPIFRVACRFNDRDQNGNITEYWHGMGKDGSHLRLDLRVEFYSGTDHHPARGSDTTAAGREQE